VPEEGYYSIGMRYCTQENDPRRDIVVNDVAQEPFSPFIFPLTGGWAISGDDWKTAYAMDSIDGELLLVKLNKGKNAIKMICNDDLGVNLDYLIIASPDMAAAANSN